MIPEDNLFYFERSIFISMQSLQEKLIKYSKSSMYPFHMPGHKRNIEWLQKYGFLVENTIDGEITGNKVSSYQMDITEIDGFDNLHDANDVLKVSMERAARVYHSEETRFLINGSSAGLLAGIAGMTTYGDKIAVARNCHKSVYHAIYLNHLNPVYMYPPIDKLWGITIGITREYVEELLSKHKGIKLIVVVSPTYEGMVSDIQGICEVAHRKGIPVLVDEAHGAHLGFSDYFPKSAIQNGADIVVQSLHKTLPAFTQTALIHFNGKLVKRERIQSYLAIYQTSSPSYVFMSAMDKCIEVLEQKQKEVFSFYQVQLENFYHKIKKLQYLSVMTKEINRKLPKGLQWESSKLIISVKHTGITGLELYDILRDEYKLQMEMVSRDYVLGMTSICDSIDGMERLVRALYEIDKREKVRGLPYGQETDIIKEMDSLVIELQTVLSIDKAYNSLGEWCSLEKSENRILKDYVYLYPPGIPIGVPGEKISVEFIDRLKECLRAGLEIKGLKDEKITIICNK